MSSGNGWVTCAQGHAHWGLFGAAGLLAYVVSPAGPDQTLVLMQHRAKWSHQGGTWALPGGAMDSDETPAVAALREADEECMLDPKLVLPRGQYTDDHGGWAYHTVLAQSVEPAKVYSDNYETDAAVWLPAAEVDQLDLHPGFADSWPVLRTALAPLTVFVDGTSLAEVYGADNSGRRLQGQLTVLARNGLRRLPDGVDAAPLARWYPDYVLLLGPEAAEGARAAADATEAEAKAAEARLRPMDRWNAPPAVRQSQVRVVTVEDVAQVDDVTARLAGATAPPRLVVSDRADVRARAEQAGVVVTGLDFLADPGAPA